MKKYIFIYFIVLFLFSCKTEKFNDPEPEHHAKIEILQENKKVTSYKCPYIDGLCKNTGDRTAYNVSIEYTAYDSNNTIIDTADGFPADLGDIPAGVSANYEAIFFKLTKWSQVDHLTVKIDFLER